MKSQILRLFVMAFVTPFTSIAVAETTEPHDQRIQAAIVLEDVAEPMIGETHCRVASKCEIIFDAKLGFKVTVDRRGEGPYGGARLTVDCPEKCSFKSGRPTTIFQDQRAFDLFRGADNYGEILTVLKPRTMLGQIFLIVE